MDIITEGQARIKVYKGKISKKLPVFYNPGMKLNRDISVSLINALDKDLDVALPLSGSGIRGIRFLLECENVKVTFNDYSKEACKLIKTNLKLNKIKSELSKVSYEDANLFLLNSCGFNYIDIDPFGSPNSFLDSAVTRIARDGILAVTATDTSALSGTYPEACMRKYWAKPLRNELKHEIGLRILARKVQLIGAQYEKALIPIFSHSTLHYMRIYFQCEKGKTKVDEILKLHDKFHDVGPMWLGQLWDSSLVDKMDLFSLDVIREESKVDVVGFYHVHSICKKLKIIPPKMDYVLEQIKKLGYKASLTHLTPFGIRTNVSLDKFEKILKK